MKHKVSSVYSMGEFCGFNVRYSPFRENCIAVAASQKFGLAGSGILCVLLTENGIETKEVVICSWPSNLFDVSWSEVNPDLVATASGDGSVQIWDILQSPAPVGSFCNHNKEVSSVEWCPHNTKQCILTTSWDATIKTCDPFKVDQVESFLGHSDHVNQACWSHNDPSVFASVSDDKTLRVWDTRSSLNECSQHFHPTEVLTCDWSKLDPNLIASGTSGSEIFMWDTRNMREPTLVLLGHRFAVRRLKFSSLHRDCLASVSYDFTTRFWNCQIASALDVQQAHTEFVCGLDFDPFNLGQFTDCAWDGLVCTYQEEK